MVRIGGGVFRMGSDRRYPEEAPAHRVEVDSFLIDRRPVTNRQFAAFVAATAYRTVAERTLDPAQFPRLDATGRQAMSMVFQPPRGPVDLRDIRNWWAWKPGAYWRHPEERGSSVAAHILISHAMSVPQHFPLRPRWSDGAERETQNRRQNVVPGVV